MGRDEVWRFRVYPKAKFIGLPFMRRTRCERTVRLRHLSVSRARGDRERPF